jgi:hypothetical protein
LSFSGQFDAQWAIVGPALHLVAAQMIVNNYTIWWRGSERTSERVPRPNAISTALFNLNPLVLGVYLLSDVAELRFDNCAHSGSRALNQMKIFTQLGPCLDLTSWMVLGFYAQMQFLRRGSK